MDDLSWARDLSDADWCAFLAGELDLSGRTPPPMPSPEFQSSWVGRAGLIALTEAMTFLSRMKAGMSEAGSPLRRDMRVLDFGAGWGRFYRILMREVDSLVAADPDPPCIQMCRSMLPSGEFLQIPALPPYPFRDGEFDLIYAYSIFTHLAEPVFDAVVREFARIVKPGGFVAFTTLPLNYIHLFHEQGNYEPVMRQVGFDPVSWQARAEAGEFLFLPTGGGGRLESSEIYGWSWIGRPCLERALYDMPFQILAMESVPGLPQEFVLIRSKKSEGVGIIGNVDQWAYDNISGWAADKARPDEVIAVELKVNGKIACCIPAVSYREDLKCAGFGKGLHGFSADPRLYLTDAINYIELIIADTNILLGERNVPGNLLEISQMRWKGDEAFEGLTWGHWMTGDTFVEVLQAHCQLSPDSSVVEVGPGYGRILSTFFQRAIPFKQYHGIEISIARTARLNDHFTDKRVHFENGDINTHKFYEPADSVISSATFVHLYPDCSKALENIRTQISSDAFIAIDFMDPAHYPPGTSFDMTTGTYVKIYTVDELRWIFQKCGYNIIAIPEYVIGTGSEIFGEVHGLMVIARPGNDGQE